MADDFLGSVAQEDVQFITEIVKTVNPGDNFKHLVVYTDHSQIADTSLLAAVKDYDGTVVAHFAEVTADSFKNVVKDELLGWLTDYFTAGGNESVFVVDVEDDDAPYSKARLTAAYNMTHQIGWFKSICIADAAATDMFHLDPDAAKDLAELCSTDELLSSAPLYPESIALVDGAHADTARIAVDAAGFDAFWVYHLPALQSDGSYVVHNGAMVALGLALSIINGSGTYAGNSFDMVATSAITPSGVDGGPLSPTVQGILKNSNTNYFKYVGDTTGDVDLRGGTTAKGKVMAAEWVKNFCNYYNKVKVANYLSQRNIYKSPTTYDVVLSILTTTVSKFTDAGSGRLTQYALSAPAYADLPSAAKDEIIVPNAWSAVYQDDVRTVKVYGTLYL